MLDIALAILKFPDDLFDLRPPAAMCRGQVSASMPHGSPIDGRRFFAGSQGSSWQEDFYEWGQVGGLNTGVVLLAQCPVDDINVFCIPISMTGLGKCHAWRALTLPDRLAVSSVLTSKRQRHERWELHLGRPNLAIPGNCGGI